MERRTFTMGLAAGAASLALPRVRAQQEPAVKADLRRQSVPHQRATGQDAR
ncbi:hypothetical protein [Ramlibacter algicola]|uniref:Uncharacterized protein n=1 Tax=Ramlibacter algicola TaxID=2795217 RepID=A0A934PZ14_9BURK|nr:hypothetical protein [Ramlibacter algicola]MBK0391667.1 hypothetical protein [Ramlibacter algicola]